MGGNSDAVEEFHEDKRQIVCNQSYSIWGIFPVLWVVGTWLLTCYTAWLQSPLPPKYNESQSLALILTSFMSLYVIIEISLTLIDDYRSKIFISASGIQAFVLIFLVIMHVP